MNEQINDESNNSRQEYIELSKRNLDRISLRAKRLGFAQLVVTGISLALAAASNDYSIAITINGISAPFLLIPACKMASTAHSIDELIKVEQRIEDKKNGRSR